MCVCVCARQNCWEHVIKFGSGIICNVSRNKVLDRLGQASYSRARFWQLARNIRRNDRSIDASVALVVNLDLALNKTTHDMYVHCTYLEIIDRFHSSIFPETKCVHLARRIVPRITKFTHQRLFSVPSLFPSSWLTLDEKTRPDDARGFRSLQREKCQK